MTTKPKKQPSKEDNPSGNSITCGEIQLSSSSLPMLELVNYLKGLLTDEVVHDYLERLSVRKFIGTSKSYVS